MKKRTLQLFQLLLAVFGLYAGLKFQGKLQTGVPVFCLIAMYVLDKLEIREDEHEAGKGVLKKGAGAGSGKMVSDPLDCVLQSKNGTLLVDAVQQLFEGLGFDVSLAKKYRVVDRLACIPGEGSTFALKILDDVSKVNATWKGWDEIQKIDQGRQGKRRVLLIASNSAKDPYTSELKYKKFPSSVENLLATKKIVAMTTLTLYKIYMLCTIQNQDPKKILGRIFKHPGGIFQMQ